ncbi:unnamed protein product, partial [Closterium sp. Naga37s-1]
RHTHGRRQAAGSRRQAAGNRERATSGRWQGGMGGDSDRTGKVQERLARRVKGGEFYEAQQLYKSLATRYSSQFKYEDAMALLQSGACVQLEHGQVTSGGELALLLTDLLSSTETPCWEDSLERITAVYTSFPRSTDPSGLLPGESEEAARLRVDGCKRFLRAALKWSAQFPEMLSAPSSPQAQAKPSSPTASSPAALASLGSPAIHLMLAHCLSSQLPPHKRDYAAAFFHFVYSDDPALFAHSLAEYAQQCYLGERDLVIARAVLQCLAAGRLQQGKQLWHDLKTKQAGIWGADDHAAGDDGADADGAADAAAAVDSGATEDRAGAAASKWQESPLLRFTDLLLTAADRRAPSLLSHLRRRYEPSLQRDPAFPPLLDDIAFRLFGVPRPAAAPNFLTDMLKLVMGEETPA